MPISLHWEARGVVRTAVGDIAADELFNSVADLQNDPRFDALRYVVEDLSAVASVALDESGLDMLIASAIGAALSNPHIRIAVVLRSPQLIRMAREFAAQSPYITRTFSTLEAARDWIAQGDVAPVPLDLVLQADVRT